MVQIAGLEVVVKGLLARRVVDIFSRLLQVLDFVGEFFRACIVQNNDPETMGRIINCACGFRRIHNGVQVFTSARDKEIDSAVRCFN